MPPTRLKEKAARLPNRPGAYLFHDSQGRVIYVGKAKNLRLRVSSYFRSGADRSPKTNLLVKQAASLDYIATASEPDALLLEMNLIKEHRPRYNVRLRDDKKYPFIKVTTVKEVPRALVTRRVVDDGSRYFGPYTDVRAMRKTLYGLQRVFGVRSCNLDLPRRRRERACLNYQMGRCLAPCVPHCTDKEYARAVERMCAFLEGGGGPLARELEEKMKEASRALRYEEAARLRDSLRDMGKVMVPPTVALTGGEERDAVAVATEGSRGVATILRVREGRLLGRDHFPLILGAESEPGEVMSAFLKEYYRLVTSVPREVLLTVRPPDAEALGRWLSERRGNSVQLKVPRRGERERLTRLARENAHLRLAEERGESRTPPPIGLENLREIIGLAEAPRRIEGFDVSTSHGRMPVGSLVVMVDAKPVSSEYRRFRLTFRGEANDPAMMRELIERRYSKLRPEDAQRPDLIVVDGGIAQLGSARKALRSLGLGNLPVVALAKREEELYLEGMDEPLGLPPDDEARRILVRLRDEAHRFAISYHRKLRRRETKQSELDRIPGLGPARKRALLRELGSVRAVREASVEQLAGVAGLGPQLAGRIHRALRRD